MTIKTRNSTLDQSGSIFFYILLGVVLFGALAFTMSRGMRSQSTEALTKRQIEIAASELLGDAQTLERGVDRLRQNSISESDLCFAHDSISNINKTAYETISACGSDENKLYRPEGGGVSFFPVPADWLESVHTTHQGYGEWIFSNENAVAGLGSGALNTASSVELIAHVNHLKEAVCAAINKELGITGIPDNVGAFDPTAPVSGSFSSGGQINVAALSGKKAGCFQNSAQWNSYIFYTVLIERD